MRPIFRGTAPRRYSHYQDAIGDLEARLGTYCSYCERRLPISLAVEHVSPKSVARHLETSWDNFLLGCTNCNSVKGDTIVNLDDWLWPDRDNTVRAFSYLDGGFVEPTAVSTKHAQRLLDLVGLQRHGATPGREPAPRDKRWKDREQVFTLAQRQKEILSRLPPEVREEALQLVVDAAVGWGFFSCWLTVLHDIPEFCRRLIARMPGTASDCFDASGIPIARPAGRC
jgi:hypothetical protein